MKLAFRLLWRDWRAGELTLLLSSLVIAIGTVTTITLFVDRLQQALVQESASFLAADRVVSGPEPLDGALVRQARDIGLETTQTLEFFSMVFASERAQFASVKAVAPGYPLRGELIASNEPFVNGFPVRDGPERGTVWLESRLMPALDINVGDVLDVGVASLTVSRVLIKEPDRGGGFMGAGPRVLMNLADVPGTEVVQPGSRLTYRHLFAGEPEVVEEFANWVKPKLGEEYRLMGVRQGTQGIGRALERGERFLLLGGLLGVILAGIAIALSAYRYSNRHFDHVAILKTLGATPRRIDMLFATVFIILGGLAVVAGSAVGWMAQLGIVKILEPFIPITLPAPGFRPLVIGGVTGFVCLIAFALPPILKLRATAPSRVIRREIDGELVADSLTYLFAIGGTFGLMWWYSGDWKLTLLIFGGCLVALGGLGSVAYLLLRSGRVLGMQAGSVWRLALAGMQRRGQQNTMQILVFGLAIMLLLILILVRTALIEEWQAQIPENAPNHFVINVSPDDVEPIREMFAAENILAQPLYPMIRGRISLVNGEEARGRDRQRRRDAPGPRSSSSRNLTWADSLPRDNVLTDGEWWDADYRGPALVSLEKDLAEANNLSVGDRLTFTIQGGELEAEVANIRTVHWDNMQPNFYIIFSPRALENFPSTFMTSFHLEQGRKLFLNQFLNRFPTLTVIEVDMIIRQIQTIIEQVTLAIELVLGLILISGGMVLLASIQASMDERFQQHAVLRTLGASRKLVLGSLSVEFCALGFFAGVLATFGSELTVFGLETQIFEIDYTAHPWLWVVGPAIGILLIGSVGTFATRRVVNSPPTTVLRELG
ncbi:MAG: permease [Gammaproteobacteria bacterium]|nr:permease [Gammaproteobacteria bacterium]